MKKSARVIIAVMISVTLGIAGTAQQSKSPRFNALVLFENTGHHTGYSARAKKWLDQLAADSNFTIRYINNTGLLDDRFLLQFQLFIQLDHPPYNWTPKAERAFQRYIEKGKGGWIGFHHASLLGQFDGYSVWEWFSQFMGDIRFNNYIPAFADASVQVEDPAHPVMKNIPARLNIEKEEWYTYNKSPRPIVKVIASVDESTYRPASEIKMGDHPVVWSNTNVAARNVYIFMGHVAGLFSNSHYTTIFRNAIFWAAARDK